MRLLAALKNFQHLPHGAQLAVTICVSAGFAFLFCLALWSVARVQRNARSLKLDRRDLGWLILAVLLLAAFGAGTNIFVSSMNGIQFTQGGADCGLGAAYVSLPSTGGTVFLSSDCSISTPQTLTEANLKPLTFDMGGHTITCTSGITNNQTCFNVLQNATTIREKLTIKNGTFAYTGSGTGVNGLMTGTTGACPPGCVQGVTIEKVDFNNFSTTGSCGLNMYNTEDSQLFGVNFNLSGLCLGLATNQNGFYSVHFQGDGVTVQPYAITMTDAEENNFYDCLVQSVKAQHVIQFNSVSTFVTNNDFTGCHFENSGDGTNSTRQFWFNAGLGVGFVDHAIRGGVVNSGSLNPVTDVVIGGTGSGQMPQVVLERVLSSGRNPTTGWVDSAFTSLAGTLTAINDPYVGAYDVGINSGNLPGVTFCPPSATKCFQILNSAPSTPNRLAFWDTTTNTLLAYFQQDCCITFTANAQPIINTNAQWVESASGGGGAGATNVHDDNVTHRLMQNNNNTGDTYFGDVVMQDCGTTSTCSATNLKKPMVVKGNVALSAGTVTVTGISPAFTSSTSFECTSYDATTVANANKCVGASASSITCTGTGTDVIHYVCAGN